MSTMNPHVSDEQLEEILIGDAICNALEMAGFKLTAEMGAGLAVAGTVVRDLYEPLVTSQKERIAALEEAIDKAAARFDGILGKMPSLSKMTATERISHDMYVANCRNEARALLTPKTT